MEQNRKNRPKVLIIQGQIPHYRVSIFNELAKSVDLAVAADYAEDSGNCQFKIIKISSENVGPFVKIKNFGSLHIDQYHAIIFTFNIRYIDLIKLLLFKNKNVKLILWGIGVSSENGYDNSKKFDRIRYWAAKRANSVIFYSNDPIKKYVDIGGVNRSKLFVAHNTLDLQPKYFPDEKKHFLFVGTLKKYKRIDRLVEIYSKSKEIYNEVAELHIVGDGEYMASLKKLILDRKLESSIILHGAITDPLELEPLYRCAIASISPYQAGLSVLQSLSMGVPFICNSDAVTGGERFNIIDGKNGFLVANEEDFSKLLVRLSNNSGMVRSMGKNAYEYFKTQCTVKNMVNGFLEAIQMT